jgi:hypothetical protein
MSVGNPRRNALFGAAPETRSLQGLDGGGCSPAKPVSNAGTGNFLKISGQNRLSASGHLLAIGNSAVIQISYTAIQALSCYSTEQAVEARQQAMHAGYQVFPQSR